MIELAELVTAFEKRTLSKDNWSHSQHLRVALHYAYQHNDLIELFDDFSPVLKRYQKRIGVSHLYSVTKTYFWLKQILKTIEENPHSNLRALELQILVSKLKNKEYIYEYYSTEILDTKKAKQGYIEPDKKVTASV